MNDNKEEESVVEVDRKNFGDIKDLHDDQS